VADTEAKLRGFSRENAGVKSGGRSKWIVLVLVAFAIQAAGLLWWRNQSEARTPGRGRIQSVLHLEPFVLNLADPEGKAYLRVGIDLGLENAMKANGEEGSAPVALVRDTILGGLSQAKPDELLTPEGKTRLKESLLQALRTRAPELGIEEVYFTEFLIQR
jgi:flagellar basal body-associated protein FliL